jgi:nitrilase
MAKLLNIQLKPTLNNKELNLKKIEFFIKKFANKNLDLVVIPEFFSTGMCFETFKATAENENGGETIKNICNLAKKYSTNIIAGTVIEKNNDKFYNTSFLINRNGEIINKYRKIHLYNYFGGNEGEIITAGEDLVVADFDFGKVGIAICFDLRFPLHYQKLAQIGAEIIVQPSCWAVPADIFNNKDHLKFAQDTWLSMNKIRAYDNMAYVVCSNLINKVSSDFYAIGNSAIIAPTSQVIKNAKNEQGAIFADIDLELVKYYRSICPILNEQ